MSELKNNLFYYATKELSQDAFICWLSSYALDDVTDQDSELVSCAKRFICILMQKGIESTVDCDKVHLVKIQKQIGHIDVLLTVEYLDKIYRIIIEDKIQSSEHDDQLSRYKNQIKNDGNELICIYYKTGFQSDLSQVKEAGYKLFNRKDILDLLSTCKSSNPILKDYREYWEDFEKTTQIYKSETIDKWPDWQAVNGFYDEMQAHLIDAGLWAGYGYVSNKSGGFWGLWYGINDYVIKDNGEDLVGVYLQVEVSWNYEISRYDYRICVKLENKTGNKQDEYVKSIKNRIIIIQEEYGFEKPSYLRNGSYMTVGLYSGVDVTVNSEQFKYTIMESVNQYRRMLECLKKRTSSIEV